MAGVSQLASFGYQEASQLLRVENSFAGGDLGWGSSSLRRVYGQRHERRRPQGALVVPRAYWMKASLGIGQEASEPHEDLKRARTTEDVSDVFTRSAQTEQGITRFKLLDPVASLVVGLALGAAVMNAFRGQHLWKSTAAPCFASISTAVRENSVAEKKGSETGPSVIKEGITSASSEESSEDSVPETDQGELRSSELLQTQHDAPNLSIESVTTSLPEQEIGKSLQVSGRGSQEDLESGVEVIKNEPGGGAIGTVSGAQESTVDRLEGNEGVEDATPGAEEIDENDIDDEDDDEDEYQEDDDARTVQRKDVAATPRKTRVAASRGEESGFGDQDEGNIFPPEEAELRQAYEEWKAKPYGLTVPLKIVGLRSSVPPAWLKDFLQTQGKNVKLAMEFQGSLKSILSGLAEAVEQQQLNARSIMAADLVTIGDSWLGTAVAGGLIEPIQNPEEHDWYHRLGSRWQTLLRRNSEGLLDPKGKIWGVPYRWGTLVIAYRTDKFKKFHVPPIKDWGDLFASDLEERLAIVDSPREVVGLVLKSLGSSFNTKDFEKDVAGGRQAVKDRFVALQKQVRLFDSVQYLKALGAGDVWVAVGWSSDVIPFAKRTSNIEVVVPLSGTSLWADLWAVPATGTVKSDRAGGRVRGPSPLVQQWFDFCVQPARALSFQQDVFVGASPLALPPSEMQGGDESSTRATAGSSTHLSEVKPSDREQENGRSSTDDDIAFLEAPEIFPLGVALNTDSKTLQSSVPEDVIARSEFLEPLSDTAVADFQWLLEDVVEVSGWPSDIIEFFKGALQNFQKWIWSRGIRY